MKMKERVKKFPVGQFPAMAADISIEKECRRISCGDQSQVSAVLISNAIGIDYLFLVQPQFGWKGKRRTW